MNTTQTILDVPYEEVPKIRSTPLAVDETFEGFRTSIDERYHQTILSVYDQASTSSTFDPFDLSAIVSTIKSKLTETRLEETRNKLGRIPRARDVLEHFPPISRQDIELFIHHHRSPQLFREF